jgi:hypothetical protein
VVREYVNRKEKFFVDAIMVQNLELPYNVQLKAQVVTDRVPAGF